MEQTENWARVTFYRSKEKLRKEIVACDIKVDGNKLTVSASMIDSMAAISSMNFKEVNGEIDIEIRVVKSSIFYNGTVKKSYIASKNINSTILVLACFIVSIVIPILLTKAFQVIVNRNNVNERVATR